MYRTGCGYSPNTRELVRVVKSLIRLPYLVGSGTEVDLPIRWTEIHENQGMIRYFSAI